MHFLHSQRPCPNGAEATVNLNTNTNKPVFQMMPFLLTLTSTELVVGAVTVEVVALAVLSTVDL